MSRREWTPRKSQLTVAPRLPDTNKTAAEAPAPSLSNDPAQPAVAPDFRTSPFPPVRQTGFWTQTGGRAPIRALLPCEARRSLRFRFPNSRQKRSYPLRKPRSRPSSMPGIANRRFRTTVPLEGRRVVEAGAGRCAGAGRSSGSLRPPAAAAAFPEEGGSKPPVPQTPTLRRRRNFFSDGVSRARYVVTHRRQDPAEPPCRRPPRSGRLPSPKSPISL